mmetsp:Transcript_12431/g.37356  ORF Transcript_12431/g.37356 Transcript_12431/m.37356 type:complete len:549 (+) Transcript_12431:235-1881(+)
MPTMKRKRRLRRRTRDYLRERDVRRVHKAVHGHEDLGVVVRRLHIVDGALLHDAVAALEVHVAREERESALRVALVGEVDGHVRGAGARLLREHQGEVTRVTRVPVVLEEHAAGAELHGRGQLLELRLLVVVAVQPVRKHTNERSVADAPRGTGGLGRGRGDGRCSLQEAGHDLAFVAEARGDESRHGLVHEEDVRAGSLGGLVGHVRLEALARRDGRKGVAEDRVLLGGHDGDVLERREDGHVRDGKRHGAGAALERLALQQLVALVGRRHVQADVTLRHRRQPLEGLLVRRREIERDGLRCVLVRDAQLHVLEAADAVDGDHNLARVHVGIVRRLRLREDVHGVAEERHRREQSLHGAGERRLVVSPGRGARRQIDRARHAADVLLGEIHPADDVIGRHAVEVPHLQTRAEVGDGSRHLHDKRLIPDGVIHVLLDLGLAIDGLNAHLLGVGLRGAILVHHVERHVGVARADDVHLREVICLLDDDVLEVVAVPRLLRLLRRVVEGALVMHLVADAGVQRDEGLQGHLHVDGVEQAEHRLQLDGRAE